MEAVPLVRVVRAGLEESVHWGDVAVVDVSGALVAFAGDPWRRVYARSSMKPLQAAVSLSLAPFDFSEVEVSVMCASHNAEPVHVEAVRSLLARAGVAEDALQTPAVRPWDDETRAADPAPRRINSDCSGKHGGMLAACLAQGWPLQTYREPDHPVQRAVLSAVLRASGEAAVHVGVDGCGVPVHGMPLAAMATIYGRLADAASLGELETFARRATTAMRTAPYMVAGRNRPDTAVMRVADGVILKGGAEGLMCAAVLDRRIGVAVKIRDGGAARASGPVMIHALRALDVLSEADVEALTSFATPPVLGGGRPVGELRVGLTLERPD